MKYFYYPDNEDCPVELTLYRQMGEHHLLVDGGLLNQPPGLWLAIQHAGYLTDILSRAKRDPKWMETFSDAEINTAEKLIKVKTKIDAKKREMSYA